jgi:fengycin family lipopeptide synthetase B
MYDVLALWEQKLQDVSLRLELPTGRFRSHAQDDRKEEHWSTLSLELSKKIKTFSRTQDIPLATVLMTALVILLNRYTGQEEIVIGSSAIEDAQPFIKRKTIQFVDTLLYKFEISGQPSFRGLLGSVASTVDLAREQHRRLIDHLPDALIQEISSSEPRLPSVLFSYHERGEIGQVIMDESRAESVEIDVFNHEENDTLLIRLRYNAAQFDPETITRMAEHLKNILSSATAQPDCSAALLPLLSQEERHQLLVEFNDNGADYQSKATIIQLFEAQVEQSPDATGLIFEDTKLTYRQLNQKANRLAHYLQKLGVGPEVCVGFCLERSMDMLISILAILKAGGAYVPLDPDYPEERLKFLLADIDATVLITKRAMASILQYHKNRVILLDEDQPVIDVMSDSNPVQAVDAGSLAYVIYTSGSTGRPKGVCCIHQSVINLLDDFERRQPVTRGEVCSWWTSVGFDVSVYEIFSALLYGRALLIVPKYMRADSVRLFELLQSHQVKSAYITPSQLKDFRDWLQTSGKLQLERLLVGVEPIHEPMLAEIARAIPSVKIINGYGPTEATVWATLYDLDPGRVEDRNTPIGSAVQNTQIYLLDKHGQPVPVGVPGELHIGGIGLSRGYLHQPELTAEKFIRNPFHSDPDTVIYRTGDLARYLPDGNIMFIGRYDEQVKIRGYRIEPGEVQFALRQHPAVKDALILAHEFSPGDKRLVAYLVMKDRGHSQPEDWRGFLRKVLPAHMIPSAFIVIDEFPLNTNGKVDRKALPIPRFGRSSGEKTFTAPRTVTEETIATVWASAFNLPKVSVFDNYFDLGGDSILSIRIASKAAGAGISITSDQIFDHPTIAELAQAVDKARAAAMEPDSAGQVPLTPIQKWFFEQDFADLHRCSQSFVLRVSQALDPSLIEKALEHLAQYHDALRMRVDGIEDSRTIVTTSAKGTVPFIHIKQPKLTGEEQKTLLCSVAAGLEAGLNLSTGPTARAALVDFGVDTAGYFIFAIHQLAVDTISWRVLLEHLSLVYRQLSQQQEVQLPQKTTVPAAWAQRLSQQAQSPSLSNELPFWQEAGASQPTRLPEEPGHGNGQTTESVVDTVSVAASVEDTRALLADVHRAYLTTITEILLAALAEPITRWTGTGILQVEMVGSSREIAIDGIDLSRTVGSFDSIYPFRLDLEGKTSTGDRLVAVKEQLRNVPNGGTGYGLLRYMRSDADTVAKLQTLSRAEVCFHHIGRVEDFLPPSSIFQPAAGFPYPKQLSGANWGYPIKITTYISEDQLFADWAYEQHRFSRASVEQLVRGFIDELKIMIEHCQSPSAGRYTPSDFPEANLSQQELDDLLSAIEDNRG